jgi:hypothetical protein
MQLVKGSVRAWTWALCSLLHIPETSIYLSLPLGLGHMESYFGSSSSIDKSRNMFRLVLKWHMAIIKLFFCRNKGSNLWGRLTGNSISHIWLELTVVLLYSTFNMLLIVKVKFRNTETWAAHTPHLTSNVVSYKRPTSEAAQLSSMDMDQECWIRNLEGPYTHRWTFLTLVKFL